MYIISKTISKCKFLLCLKTINKPIQHEHVIYFYGLAVINLCKLFKSQFRTEN